MLLRFKCLYLIQDLLFFCTWEENSYLTILFYHQEEGGYPKPKSACPKRFKQQQWNKTCIKCALLSLEARDWDKPKWPRLQSFSWMLCAETKHGFKALQFGGLFSFLLLSRKLSFFLEWINLQRFLPVLICFTICGLMCLSLRQVGSNIYCSELNFYFSQTIGQRFCCTLCVLHRDQYLKRKKGKGYR